MKSQDATKVHWSFWLIGAVALVWNAMGAINFIVQMNPEMTEAYRTNERMIIEARPFWATLGFAVAVFGGTLGSLLLLFKRKATLHVFIASFLGVILTTIHTLALGIDFGIGELIGIIAMPAVVAGFLIWYAKSVEQKAWLG